MARSVIEEYAAAQDPYDGGRLARLRHPEWSAEWPQSRERIPSHEADRQINEHYPGYPAHTIGRLSGREERWALSPSMTPVRVTEIGNLWTLEAILDYPSGGRWLAAGLGELRDGLVYRERIYFCQPFEAPEWRSRWTDRIPEADGDPLAGNDDQGDEEQHRRAIDGYLSSVKSEMAAAIPLLWHEDAIVDYPQSGERFRGIENIMAVPSNHPSPPRPQAHRITGEGDLFVLENDLVYDGSPWFELVILGFRGERVARSIHYFAEPFERPEWRAQWVEQIER